MVVIQNFNSFNNIFHDTEFCDAIMKYVIMPFQCFVSWMKIASGRTQNSLLTCQFYSISIRMVTHSSPKWEVCGWNLGPIKSDTALPTVRHRSDISWKGAVLPAIATIRRWADQLVTRFGVIQTASIMKDLIDFDLFHNWHRFETQDKMTEQCFIFSYT